MRSKSSEAFCAMESSSTKNSWNSSIISKVRGIGSGAAGFLVPRDILDSQPSEKIPSPLQFFIDPLEHAETELAIALDSDDARMRQPLRGVALEFDAFLEVDQVELDLLRAAGECEIRDDDVEERRFARASLACKERVLAGALADREGTEASSHRCGPMGMRNSDVVSFFQRSAGGGTICENGTSTRFESMLLFPILWISRAVTSGSGGASKTSRAPCANWSAWRMNSLPSRRRQMLFFRRSSATKPSGNGWRRSQ
jgi:hypothetical protein